MQLGVKGLDYSQPKHQFWQLLLYQFALGQKQVADPNEILNTGLLLAVDRLY